MTTKTDRAPSERTSEAGLADKIDELTRELRTAERRPGGSWWDQLPAECAALFRAHSCYTEWDLPGNYGNTARIRVQQFPNCLDLSLVDWQGTILWQRRLFFGPPASP